MTSRENFHRMMRGEPYGWVPFDLPLTPPMVDELERRHGTRDPGEAYRIDFRFAWADGPRNADRWREAYAALGIEIPDGAWVGDTGYVERPGDANDVGAAYHLTEMFHPLASVETMDQLLGLPWHDLEEPAWYEQIGGMVDRIHREGFVATISAECTVFESAWYLRGMEPLFMDLVEENGIGDWLLDRMRDQSLLRSKAFALAGGDLIRLGDDVGTQRGMMMSAAFWRKHLKPRLAQVIEAAKTCSCNSPYIQYHSDGDIREIVDDLIEIGVDILNPVQPECMDLDEVAPRWMDRLGFCGMIGTQTTMPFGDVEAVRREVASCAKWIGRGARMIVAPTHVLEPDVPWANVEALVEAVTAIRPPG